MMRAAVDAATAPVGIPVATFARLAGAALSLLVLLCLPLSVLKQIDALLAYMTPARALWSCGITALVAAAIAAGLAVVVSVVRWIAVRLLSRTLADAIAWFALLVPCSTVCLWQFVAAIRLWTAAVLGTELTVSPGTRFTAMILVVAGSALLAWTRRWGLLVAALVRRTTSATPLAVLIVAAGVVAAILHPPQIFAKRSPTIGAAAKSGAPDIILITIDTLSEVDAAVCGRGPTLMPRLRAFAQSSTCFSHFYASANFTVPATSTIETGALPWTHRAVQPGADIVRGVRTSALGAVLGNAGYRTEVVSGNLLASPVHHGTDGAYSTDELVASRSVMGPLGLMMSYLDDAAVPTLLAPIGIVAHALDIYIDGTRSPDNPRLVYARGLDLLRTIGPTHPTFLWMHTLPPHAPYLPPSSTRHRFLPAGQLESWSDFLPENLIYPPSLQPLVDKHRLRYRESILGADETLGQLLGELQRDGRFADSVIVVSSDHGELFEKGYMGHAGNRLDDPLLHIPLVIHMPSQHQSRVINTPISQADLLPTLAELAGTSAPRSVDGRSIATALLGGTIASRPVFAMAMERTSRFAPLQRGTYAIIDWPLKLVHRLDDGHDELYDLAVDPDELRDLALIRTADRDRLRGVILAEIHAAESRRAKDPA